MFGRRRETTAREDHQQRILEEFQDAAAQREQAIDVYQTAERAMVDAEEKFVERRRALRRVAEGAI